MSNRYFPMIAATLVMVAWSPALAAPNGAAELAKMDCAALAKEMAASQQKRVKLFSTPMSDPQALGKQMMVLGERDAAIQTQREAKKCPNAVIDNNDLGK